MEFFFNNDVIIRFMRNNAQSKKFTLNGCTPESEDIYRVKFEDEWIITEINDGKGLSFERRVLDFYCSLLCPFI